jgi:hypothetical protein
MLVLGACCCVLLHASACTWPWPGTPHLKTKSCCIALTHLLRHEWGWLQGLDQGCIWCYSRVEPGQHLQQVLLPHILLLGSGASRSGLGNCQPLLSHSHILQVVAEHHVVVNVAVQHSTAKE